MNIKLVSRYIGIALLFNASFMYLSVAVSMLYGFDASFSPLLISAFITMIVGIFPLLFVRESENISTYDGFAITIFSWLLSCVFGMLPYVIYGGEFSLSNAWFESVSGFTTTGATILSDIEALPKGLLFWRSSTHFIGGIGVVIFMLLVLPQMSTFRIKMSKMEISSLSRDNYKFKTKETLKVISSVYVGITLLTTISLMIAGMTFFDAVNHAFSIVATGGFSTRNLSIAGYDSFPIEFVSMLFMLISSLHFGMIYSSVVNRSFKIFKSPIIRFFLASLLVASLFVALDLKITESDVSWAYALRHSFFQVISLGSTTGFASADTSVWPAFSIMILMYMSMQAACSGSTSGGLKADRVWIFYQTVKTQIKRHLHPNAVIPIRVGNSTIDQDVASNVSIYIALYFFIILIVAAIVSMTGVNFIDSVSASIASMGSIGPGFGSCGSLGNFGQFPEAAKFFLSIQMLLGRLEIYTPLMIFVIFKKR